MTHLSNLLNRERADAVMRHLGLDALLVALPENWLYVTGFEDAVAATIGLPTIALLRRDPLGVSAIAIPRLLAGFAAAELSQVDDVVLYGEFPINMDEAPLRGYERGAADLLEDSSHSTASPVDAIELILRLSGVDRGHVAVDDPSVAQMAQEKVPACRLMPGRKVLEEIRAVKMPEELTRLAAAAAIAEELEQLAFEHIIAGSVWDDYVADLPVAAARRGGKLGFFSGGAGWRSAFMFPPVEEPLGYGDLIRLDLSISHRGYWADSGRTACLGTPSSQVRKRYGGIRLAVEAAVAVVRPGVTFADVYDAAMKAVQQHIPGYRRRHCGHTIGLRPYDGLLVAPDEATVLETNMVLNIEVPYYGLGWGGLQLEDTIVVTADGCSPLTRMSHDLLSISAN